MSTYSPSVGRELPPQNDTALTHTVTAELPLQRCHYALQHQLPAFQLPNRHERQGCKLVGCTASVCEQWPSWLSFQSYLSNAKLRTLFKLPVDSDAMA